MHADCVCVCVYVHCFFLLFFYYWHSSALTGSMGMKRLFLVAKFRGVCVCVSLCVFVCLFVRRRFHMNCRDREGYVFPFTHKVLSALYY